MRWKTGLFDGLLGIGSVGIGSVGIGSVGIVLLGIGLLAGVGACKNDAPPPSASLDAAAPSEPEWTRPGPYEDPETALQALFEALTTRDAREIAATLVSVDECLAVTNDRSRCQKIAQRRQAFVALFQRTPLPADAHLVTIVLEKSIELGAEDQQLTRSVRIQPGTIRFRTGETVAAVRSVAAMQVEGGWRVLPGEPKMPQPPQPPQPSQPSTEGAAGNPGASAATPAAAPAAPAPPASPAPAPETPVE